MITIKFIQALSVIVTLVLVIPAGSLKAQTFPPVPTSSATDSEERIQKHRKVAPFSYQKHGRGSRKAGALTQRAGQALRKTKKKGASRSKQARIFQRQNHFSATGSARQRQKSLKKQTLMPGKDSE